MVEKLRKIHVGCGPHNLLEEWTNVDIRPFKGIDEVMDVTETWPFQNVQFVFGEHFIEHLDLKSAIAFLTNAGNSMVEGGILRLTTPNLNWVMKTHYSRSPDLPDDESLHQVLRINRAFHGWGHQFLWDEFFLRTTLERLNFASVTFERYGESVHEELRDLERHGGYSFHGDTPNLLVVEAVRGPERLIAEPGFQDVLERDFIRHTESGH